MRSTLTAAALLSALMTSLAGTALAQPAFPPPPPEVQIGPPPGPPGQYVVEPGHYTWVGNQYVWVGRQWVFRQPGWGRFVPGHWGPRGHWIPEHWRP